MNCSVSVLRSQCPDWLMRKKSDTTPQHDVDALLDSIASAHAAFRLTIDGVEN